MLRVLQCTGFGRFVLQPASACSSLRHVDEARAMTSSAVQQQSEEGFRAAKRLRANSTSSDSSVTLVGTTDSASSYNKEQLLAEPKSPMTVAMAEPKLLVQLDPEHPNARAPTRGSALAAGYDLYASQSVTIPKGGRKIVPTCIRIAIPPDTYGRVAPRSGLASKHGIDVGAGVIDADYRGLVGVLLYNFGENDFVVNTGDRIAQLVLERIMTPDVETVQTLEDTVRGAGGFGSTGGFGQKP